MASEKGGGVTPWRWNVWGVGVKRGGGVTRQTRSWGGSCERYENAFVIYAIKLPRASVLLPDLRVLFLPFELEIE